MNYLNVLALDRNINHLNQLKSTSLAADFRISMTGFFDEEKFLDCLYQNRKTTDAIIVNADKTGGTNGFDIASAVASSFPEIEIVFSFSGHQKNIEEMFLQTPELRPFGIIIFPSSDKTIEKIFTKLLQNKISLCRRLVITVNGKKIIYNTCDIILIESDRRKLTFTMPHEVISAYGQISKTIEKLPGYFLMPHTSYIINSHYIKAVDKTHVYLQDGKKIPISRGCRREFADRLALLTGLKEICDIAEQGE